MPTVPHIGTFGKNVLRLGMGPRREWVTARTSGREKMAQQAQSSGLHKLKGFCFPSPHRVSPGKPSHSWPEIFAVTAWQEPSALDSIASPHFGFLREPLSRPM